MNRFPLVRFSACLVNDSEFEVEFHLVESEIREVKLGDEVKVIPLEKRFKGKTP